MSESRRLILILLSVFLLAKGAAAKAPVVPTTGAPAADDSCRLDEAETREILLFGLSDQGTGSIDAYARAAPLVGVAEVPGSEPVDMPRPVVLKEGRGSFGLCLYALVGLGLCHSGQRVRCSRLATFPDWYHSGAPRQVGGSHAIGPDARCVQTVCFVQPGLGVQRWSLHHDRRDFSSWLGRSQFIPSVLACRPPPRLS